MSHSTPTPSSKRDAGRIVAIVAGTIVALAALVSLALGGTAIGVHSTQRDADGYYTSSSKTLVTPTYALVADKLEVGTDPAWLFRKGRLGTIRVAATGSRGNPVFVGIAKKSQVASYLGHVRHDTISDFELDPFTVTYGHASGTATPTAPGAQHFWASEATGSGPQTLSWPVQKGDWAVVVMNARRLARYPRRREGGSEGRLPPVGRYRSARARRDPGGARRGVVPERPARREADRRGHAERSGRRDDLSSLRGQPTLAARARLRAQCGGGPGVAVARSRGSRGPRPRSPRARSAPPRPGTQGRPAARATCAARRC